MSQTGLKIVALILMLGDHVGEFIPGAPFILRIAGRISAPLFVFCAREGFRHTRDRKIYLARLYRFSLLMGCINRRLAALFPAPYAVCSNNIFTSLFLIFLFAAIQTKTDSSRILQKPAAVFAFINLLTFFSYLFLKELFPAPAVHLLRAALPCVLTSEGDILIFAMGLIFFYSLPDKDKIYTGYTLLCALYRIVTLSARPENYSLVQWTFKANIQWLQILALPIILCYNNRRGRGLKYLFYRFYPVHIVILYIIGNIIYQM